MSKFRYWLVDNIIGDMKLSEGPVVTRYSVVLTGSTGNIGAYILDQLMQHPHVDTVMCLNRSSQAKERQIENHRNRGLTRSAHLLQHEQRKVEFVQSDFSRSDLGVSAATFNWICQNTTHVLHNAWPVDFNKTFATFEPHILGVRHFIELTQRCTMRPLLFFVSSIGVVARWGTVAGALEKVPEVELEDWRTARMGYGQSKLVSERILLEASRSCGIRVAVCRVGQVAGPIMRGEEGSWSRQEWLPSLIASSETIKIFPDSLGSMDQVDWVPVDILGQIMIELLFSSNPSYRGKRQYVAIETSIVYQVANSRISPWSSILPTIKSHLSKEVEFVSFIEWVDALEESTKRNETMENPALHPAAKLLTFFDDLRDKAIRFPNAKATTLDTTKTRKRSPTLNDLEAVNVEWMDLWLRQWQFV